MGRRIKIMTIGLILLLLLPLLSSSASAVGLGVAPNRVVIDDVLRGSEYQRMITIFKGTGEPLTVSLNASGDAASWISFHEMADPYPEIETITLVSDEGSFLLKIKVPDDAPNGEHRATLLIQRGADGGSIVLGVEINVIITVTGTQIMTGVVKSISTTDTEVNYPLRIKVEFRNTGNVVANPEIAVKITKDEKRIAEFTHSETGVKVESMEIIPVEWDTTRRESGDYAANVTVSLGGEVLAAKELQFKLLPVGTLSRQGSLTDISIEGEPSVGKVIKILATFRNTGEIDTKAKFVGEVYMDDDLVDTISSEELLVPVRETGTLTAYLKIEQDGSYTIKGHAVYEGKTTETKELSFDVATKAETEPTPNSIPGFGAIGVIIAIASVMGYLVYRRRKSEW